MGSLQTQLNNVVNKLATRNQNMAKRRCVNCGNAVDDQDYVTKHDMMNNLAPSAYTDTTNAQNIKSGVLQPGRLPNPTLKFLGGIRAINQVVHKVVGWIDTKGNPQLVQLGVNDISGLIQPPTQQVALGLAIGTTYQNNYGKPLYVYAGIYITAAGSTEVDAYSDGASIPTTQVQKVWWVPTASTTPQIVFPMFFLVLPGNYYRIVQSVGSGATVNLSFGWY